MRSLAVSFAAVLISTAVAGAAGMPNGAFTCQRFMAADYAKSAPGDFMPSVLGTFTLDGKGGYVHPTGKGTVALTKDFYRFMDGPMKGVIGVLRKDAKGRIFFHIDKEIIEMPKTQPREFDVVCTKT
jgi:hypothetical protein